MNATAPDAAGRRFHPGMPSRVERSAIRSGYRTVVKFGSGQHRKFAHESLHREPILDEISDFFDH
ncbi:MAG TPA: hypothetical protein VMT95_14840 [Candidatus Binatia bacterium]|nr:hypothetical protein [Candidatus Binatia bacterium]